MARRSAALVILALAAISGCGGSASPQKRALAVSSHDRKSAEVMGRHGQAWGHAYDRWNKAYLAQHRGPFLRVAAQEYPVLAREGDAIYSSAASVNDPGIRHQYLALATNYLAQTSSINLTDIAVRSTSMSQLKVGIHGLDRARRRRLQLLQRFQDFFQKRYGSSPFSSP